jgi:O-antigen ligase
MSNFYYEPTFSQGAETVLDEQIATETTTTPIRESKTYEAPAVRTKQQSYALFHSVLLFYLYLYCTRIPELIPQIRLALVMTVIMLAGAMATGKAPDLFQTRLGKLLVAFCAWTAICVPMSVWPGGSFDVLKGAVLSVLLVSFLIAFACTIKEVKHAMYSIGLAMGSVAILSFSLFGEIAVTTGGALESTAPTAGGEQRLGLFHSATLLDPNTLSLYLLIGLPFLWLGVKSGNWVVRILCLALLPGVLAALAHSASRMALVLFVIGLLMFLYRASMKERAFVLVSVGLMVAMIVPVLPQTTINRFTTFFKPATESFEAREAAESARVRWELLQRSIVLTALHPVFGVGPGQFQVGEDLLAQSEGKARGIWFYTHNAYTQTSSEAGIPALILYIMALVTANRGLTDLRKRGPTPEIREMAKAVRLSLWMVILGGLFLTTGFGGPPFAIMGMCVAFKLAVGRAYPSARPAANAA